ncbi:MAG: AGE family epimerase/isomerase [Victivallaceae bacterium]|nr:AGE family epimerase/isomerase [Victivallaceae bacterium]
MTFDDLRFVPDVADPDMLLKVLDRATENSLRFWTRPEVTDSEFGGLHFWFDSDGNRIPFPPEQRGKSVINLLRVMMLHGLWLAEHPEDTRVSAQLERGFRFLEEHHRDPATGCYYNWLELDGSLIREKGPRWFTSQLDSISTIYVMYIAAELAGTLGDVRYLKVAEDAFMALEKYAWDSEFGGYYNTMIPDERKDFAKSAGQNMHMALALSRLIRVSDRPEYREKAARLVGLLERTMNEYDLAYNDMDREWKTPVFSENPRFYGSAKVLAGHDAEVVWYLEDAAEAAGIPYPAWLERLGRKLTELIEDDGLFVLWCDEKGGYVRHDGVIWWSQFEVMIMLARLYKRTRDAKYWERFNRVMRFTFEKLMNPGNGVFYCNAQLSTGKVSAQGGLAWKGGWHVVRALIESRKVAAFFAGGIEKERK